jgi:hypothetical protein
MACAARTSLGEGRVAVEDVVGGDVPPRLYVTASEAPRGAPEVAAVMLSFSF